jgi:fermentation-respiration switch protein FrsA (DUF1100 family)
MTRRARRLLLGGAALLALAAAGLVVCGWLLVRPHRTAVGPPPAAFATESVEFTTSDGLALSGWFVRGAPRAGAVVLMHGIRSDRRENVGVAQELARRRFSVLLFDFRAEGESEGGSISIGARESEDARAALDLVRRELPGEKVGAIGRSMGGAAALLGGGPLPFDALVLESVYPDIEQATDARMRLNLGAIGPWFSQLLLVQLRPWLRIGVDDLRPVDAVRRLRAPLMVLVGDHDRFLPVAEAKRVFDAAPPSTAAQPKEFWVVPGADHEELRHDAPAEYDRKVVGFLEKWLRR